MTQQSISASSKYWDDKQITLTEKTKASIMKKAYTLDAENLFAQYQLEGEDAINAATQNGVTQEQLVANPNSYTFLGMSAITDLEANASKESRVNAIQNLTKLGYTNVYEENSKGFILPPEEPTEEQPVQPQAQPEPESRSQYLRRQRPPEQVYQPTPQETYSEPEPGPSPRASLAGAARFIPNTVRQHLPMRGPNGMTPARLSPRPEAYVSSRSNLPDPRGRAPQRSAPPASRFAPQKQVQNQPVQPRSLLNAGMAAKLGSSGIKRPGVDRITPRAGFGLKGRR
jgi:hypothetical protein